MQHKLSIYIPLIFAILLAMGMALGFKMYESIKGKQRVSSAGFISKGGGTPLDEILNYVQAKYVDTVDTKNFLDEALNGVLHDLDPHSSYISPSELSEVEESLQGNFDGIGVEFSIVDDTINVITPIAGGPSESVGIRAGDKIVKIEDSSAVKLKNEQVIKKLRGEKGSKVNVSIKRGGVKELLAFTITRNKIPLVSVDVAYMIDQHTAYIKVNRFSEKTYEEFRDKLSEMKQKGATKLILDLRQNPGGYLDAAVEMADEFLPGQGMIVYTEGRVSKRDERKAGREGIFENGEVAVLIDEGSASASEIVSGALQDWDRATIIGRRSFGKGLVQEQYPLKNGGALRLTVARYYTPTGRSIQKDYGKGYEAYEKELVERYEGGELEHPDSLLKPQVDTSKVYKTLIKGRKVYGGGGIMPDIAIPIEKYASAFSARARSIVPQFVYSYYSQHTSDFEQYPTVDNFDKNFTISNQLFEAYRQTLKKELKFIDEKQLNLERSELENYMKALFARQLWSNNGYYPIINKNDKAMQRAYNELNAVAKK